MAAFLAEGLFARHLRRSTREYAARHDADHDDPAARLRRPARRSCRRSPGLHLAAWSCDDRSTPARWYGVPPRPASWWRTCVPTTGSAPASPGSRSATGASSWTGSRPACGGWRPAGRDIPGYDRDQHDDRTGPGRGAHGGRRGRRGARGRCPAPSRAEALRRVADAMDAAAGELVPLAQPGDQPAGAPAAARASSTAPRSSCGCWPRSSSRAATSTVTLDSPDSDWPAGGRAGRAADAVAARAGGQFRGQRTSRSRSAWPAVTRRPRSPPAARWWSRRTPATRSCPRAPASLVAGALTAAGLPAGAFAVVYGEEVGRAALADPRMKAGAFTGSPAGGRALFDLACARPDPIPFYAEMGSVNPAFVTRAGGREPGRRDRGRLPRLVHAGHGPVLHEAGPAVRAGGCGAGVRVAPGRTPSRSGPPRRLLNDRIAQGYERRLAALTAHPAVSVLHAGASSVEGPAPTLLGYDGRGPAGAPRRARRGVLRPDVDRGAVLLRRGGCWRAPARSPAS